MEVLVSGGDDARTLTTALGHLEKDRTANVFRLEIGREDLGRHHSRRAAADQAREYRSAVRLYRKRSARGQGLKNHHPGRHHRITPALPPAADQVRGFLGEWRSVPDSDACSAAEERDCLTLSGTTQTGGRTQPPAGRRGRWRTLPSRHDPSWLRCREPYRLGPCSRGLAARRLRRPGELRASRR